MNEISEILDAELEIYAADEDAEPPSFAKLIQSVNVEVLAKGAGAWLSSSRWEQAIVNLLERSFPFEVALDRAITNAKKEKEWMLEHNPLGLAMQE